ncbi:Denticleless protein-like protein, partial [Mucuna pruriens]
MAPKYGLLNQIPNFPSSFLHADGHSKFSLSLHSHRLQRTLPSNFHFVFSLSFSLLAVRKRPRMDGFVHGFNETGAVAIQHFVEDTIPLALSFCETIKFSHILAVSDEDGYVNLFDTRRKFPVTATLEENAEKAKICNWVSHHNAVFDICWIKEDTQILTASGDQTIKLWDVQGQKCLGVLTGHTGSVKSLCSHPTNAGDSDVLAINIRFISKFSDIIVSGSRDGSFRIWDLRCKSTAKSWRGEVGIYSMGGVKGAHISSQGRRTRRGKAASMSITSVLCLKDQVSIATAGAVDSVLKFWDTRNLKSIVTQTGPSPQSTGKERLHGTSSLVYLYNTLQLEKRPLKSFCGARIESFFVKCAISPDASNIVSGSSDGNAYVWKVDKPLEDPTILKSHDGEVTSVNWCSSEIGKLATCSDDFTVRTWNKNSYVSRTQCASAIRRRVMAIPSIECKMLLNNGKKCESEDPFSSDDALDHAISSPTPITPPKMNHTNQLSSGFDLSVSSEKTPESVVKSPSSVLSPPPSLKRTIRDYFLASSTTFIPN